MKQTTYETPVMTEFEMLAEQTVLTASEGGKTFGDPNQAGAQSSVKIWGEF